MNKIANPYLVVIGVITVLFSLEAKHTHWLNNETFDLLEVLPFLLKYSSMNKKVKMNKWFNSHFR